jgi:hypothetical protein
MKKIVMLALMIIFLGTGAAFAENWIIFFKGDQFNSFFDAGRVVTKGNGYDYWTRDEYSPKNERLYGDKYLVAHNHVELRNNEWWICRLEYWKIDRHGSKHNYRDYTAKPRCQQLTWSNDAEGKALLDGLRKYAR